jgi:antitoxin component YwqK of YwqJK toxin-antitoxin module
MKLKLFLILLTFSFVCQGQTVVSDIIQEVNFKDVTEINGLVYYKVDSTLVTGRIIRYNKNNKAKSYVLVSNGKPDSFGWIQIKEKYQEPDKNLNTKHPVNVVNEEGIIIGSIEDPIVKYDDQMSDRKDITTDLQSNINASVIEKPRDRSYKVEVLENNMVDHKVEKNGIWEQHYSNGNLESKGVYINGKKDGLWQEYYENGKLMRKENYKEGVKDGQWEQYHANGQLKGKGLYKDDRMIGEWKYFDDNGKLLLTENYNN